jgi:PAS domain S-box-containing protein
VEYRFLQQTRTANRLSNPMLECVDQSGLDMSKQTPKRPIRKPSKPKSRLGPSDGSDEALLDATQRLESILAANEVASWTWDVVNDRVIADKNLARLFGLQSSEGPIQIFIDAIHPDDRPTVAAAIGDALEGKTDRYAIDYRVVRPGGGISWLAARGKVELGKEGKPRYFPGVVVDITERKASQAKAEELRFRLEQQAHLFDITLASITDFAYVFDRKGRFAFVNQALLSLWGLTLEDAVGKDFFDLKYPADLAERLQRQIQQVFDTKKGLTDETPYTSPTGAGGYYEYIFRPVFGRDGSVEAVAGSTRDITERKRIEEELRHSQEQFRSLVQTLDSQVSARTAELEQRNNEVLKQTDLLRNLSVSLMEAQDREGRRIARELHDSVGQIIVALLMKLSAIFEQIKVADPGLGSEVQEALSYAEELNQEIRTMSYLLHPPLLDEIGLEAALRWYAEGLEQRAGLKVQLEISDKFERLSREMEITVFRVVQECLTNVHRHSGSKSALVRLGREQGTLSLEVRDAGRGIAPNRLDTLRAVGAGIGLRGVKERVRQFAGEVRIDSEVGTGTAVFVSLPLQPSR